MQKARSRSVASAPPLVRSLIMPGYSGGGYTGGSRVGGGCFMLAGCYRPLKRSTGCAIPTGCINGEQTPVGPFPPDPHPDPRRDRCGNRLPPASRRYSVPPGFRANPYSPSNQVVFDPAGSRVINPYYNVARREAGGINWRGVGSDFYQIGEGVAFSFAQGWVLGLGGRAGEVLDVSISTAETAGDAASEVWTSSQCSR